MTISGATEKFLAGIVIGVPGIPWTRPGPVIQGLLLCAAARALLREQGVELSLKARSRPHTPRDDKKHRCPRVRVALLSQSLQVSARA